MLPLLLQCFFRLVIKGKLNSKAIMKSKVLLLLIFVMLLSVESESQFIRRRRKKILPTHQGYQQSPSVKQKKITEVQDEANENNYFARKVFRKKKVVPGTVVTSPPPPIPVRPFQSQNSAHRCVFMIFCLIRQGVCLINV